MSADPQIMSSRPSDNVEQVTEVGKASTATQQTPGVEEGEVEEVKATHATNSSEPPLAPSLFKLGENLSRKSWSREASDENTYVQITVERMDLPNGFVIYDKILPKLLFSMAPALRKHMYGRCIVLPDAAAIDEDSVNAVVDCIMKCTKENTPLSMHIKRKPIPMIKVHCVLTLFEMAKEAKMLLAALWDLFASRELRLKDVLWIWDTFGVHSSGVKALACDSYVPPCGTEYLEMMAWQIVNMDAEGKLNDSIRSVIEWEKEPKFLTDMLKTRVEKYGLRRELATTESHESKGTKKVAENSASGVELADDIDPKKSAVTVETYPVFKNPSFSSPKAFSQNSGDAHKEKNVIGDVTQENDHGHISKLDFVNFQAPKFISKGFVNPFEGSMMNQTRTQNQSVPFGKPERSQGIWGGLSASNPGDAVHCGTIDSVIRPDTTLDDISVKTPSTPETSNMSWSFGVPKPPCNDTYVVSSFENSSENMFSDSPSMKSPNVASAMFQPSPVRTPSHQHVLVQSNPTLPGATNETLRQTDSNRPGASMRDGGTADMSPFGFGTPFKNTSDTNNMFGFQGNMGGQERKKVVAKGAKGTKKTRKYGGWA